MQCMTDLTDQVTFRVTAKVKTRLLAIADEETRRWNEIARFLLERGLAAYKQDKELFEPPKSIPSPTKRTTKTLVLGRDKRDGVKRTG